MDAVVVTPQLDWRLSGFDLLSEHSGVTSYTSPLRYSARMVQNLPSAFLWSPQESSLHLHPWMGSLGLLCKPSATAFKHTKPHAGDQT